MTELENWMCCFLWTQLNTYFSPWSLPNLSEAYNFSAANTNMVLNFPKLERHILVWKALYREISKFKVLTTTSTPKSNLSFSILNYTVLLPVHFSLICQRNRMRAKSNNRKIVTIAQVFIFK